MWVWGRLRLGWTVGVKVAVGSRGMAVKATRQCAKDKKGWGALVHMWMIEFNSIHFCLTLCSFEPSSHAEVDYHLERSGIPLHDAVGVTHKTDTTAENQLAIAWRMAFGVCIR